MEETDWTRIASIYDRLSEVMPSPVVDLNRAVAHGMAYGPDAALELIEEIEAKGLLENYAPLPAARADTLFRAGRASEARPYFERAAAMTRNSRERDFLLKRAAECVA
jgi:predicted RNA polymerase sigma factor